MSRQEPQTCLADKLTTYNYYNNYINYNLFSIFAPI